MHRQATGTARQGNPEGKTSKLPPDTAMKHMARTGRRPFRRNKKHPRPARARGPSTHKPQPGPNMAAHNNTEGSVENARTKPDERQVATKPKQRGRGK
eukprot:IDg13297t1